MKIELVQPLHADYGRLGKRESFVFKPAQLTMPYLAALVPEEIEVSISDEMAAPLDTDTDADLVGITFVTPFAGRAYELADIYRLKGKTVVLGGPHASLLPEEAKRHADSVVVGEADLKWPELIGDFRDGRMKPFYRQEGPVDLRAVPFARMDMLKRKSYIVPDVIQASRGCPFSCDFCTLGAIYGRGQRTRPVEEVIREIETFRGDTFVFWDDNIVGTPSYAKELFRRLIPLRKKWAGQGSLTAARDGELLSLAAKSGCIGLFVGVESVSQESLESVNKGFNRVQALKEDIRKFHDAGLAVLAGIIFGFDTDDESVFDRTLETAIKIAIDEISFSILTPYPGTPLFRRLEAEGRILHYDWAKYNSEHVVFVPKRMSPEELQEGHNRANRQFYSVYSIFSRLARSRTQLGVMIRLNMADREYSYNRFRA